MDRNLSNTLVILRQIYFTHICRFLEVQVLFLPTNFRLRLNEIVPDLNWFVRVFCINTNPDAWERCFVFCHFYTHAFNLVFVTCSSADRCPRVAKRVHPRHPYPVQISIRYTGLPGKYLPRERRYIYDRVESPIFDFVFSQRSQPCGYVGERLVVTE